MGDMEKRIDRLESLEAIRTLIASYGPLADSGDADAVARLWTVDGEYAVGEFGTAKGHDEIGDLIRSETHRGLMAQGSAHILSPHYVDVCGNHARATGYSVVFRQTGDGFEPWRVSANRWILVRENGDWRVQRRENAPLDGSKSAIDILGGIHVT